jgi:heme-degrading monooxygenase HmoA
MILEVATLDVIPGKEQEFEVSFSKAQRIISGMDGYISHQLHKCIIVSSSKIS